MGTITVVDQNSAPVWGVPGRLGLRGSGPFDPNTFEEKHVDRAGHIDFQFAARGICARLELDPKTQLWTVHFNHNEGFNPDWHNYTNASVDMSPDGVMGDAGARVVLSKTGNPPPPPPPPPPSTGNLTTITGPDGSRGFGTVAEWKVIVHHIVSELPHGAIMEPVGGPQPNMQYVNRRVRDYHPLACLQNNSGGDLKPRFFAPNEDQSTEESRAARPCDFGNFGLPFFHSTGGGTDEWVPTGRPPGTQW